MTAKHWNFILAIALVAVSIFWFKSESDYREVKTTKPDTAVNYWKDKYGHEHATLEQHKVSSAAAAILYGKEIDSLAKLYNTVAGKIIEHTVWKDRVSIDVVPGRVDTAYVKTDSSYRGPKIIESLTGTFTDPWLDALVTLGKASRIKITTTDTVSHNRYSKGFFNPKTYIDLSHTSPYVKTYGVTSFAVEDASSRLEVVAFAGGGYSALDINLKRPVPVFGLGVGYRLFSLGKR